MIVIGLGFGDEGKGNTVSHLCSKVDHPLVIRFNGGHQAGHTVVRNGIRHVFSSFGSGTLQGVPTLVSHHCTIHPAAILNERDSLIEKGIKNPQLMIHPLCPVTTPYDVEHNKGLERRRKQQRTQVHGSVGVGFGATVQRQEDFYKLYAQDLLYPTILRAKLANIRRYYDVFDNGDRINDQFLKDCEDLMEVIGIQNYEEIKLHNFDYIFEGAQGVLLDQDFGFFPNVTRSNTTSKNAIEIYRTLTGDELIPDIYYITRTYQTRHGAGFMSNENLKISLINNEDETNVSHEFQGDFRVGELDVELLNYAIECDSNFSGNAKRHLVVTCLDQYPIDIDKLKNNINWILNDILISASPDASKISI